MNCPTSLPTQASDGIAAWEVSAPSTHTPLACYQAAGLRCFCGKQSDVEDFLSTTIAGGNLSKLQLVMCGRVNLIASLLSSGFQSNRSIVCAMRLQLAEQRPFILYHRFSLAQPGKTWLKPRGLRRVLKAVK